VPIGQYASFQRPTKAMSMMQMSYQIAVYRSQFICMLSILCRVGVVVMLRYIFEVELGQFFNTVANMFRYLYAPFKLTAEFLR
jgi:hypothetical protein